VPLHPEAQKITNTHRGRRMRGGGGGGGGGGIGQVPPFFVQGENVPFLWNKSALFPAIKEEL
jgi:hypothetical protein